MFTIHAMENYMDCYEQERLNVESDMRRMYPGGNTEPDLPVPENRRDETNNEVLEARQATMEALQNSVNTIVGMFSAQEVMEALAKGYQCRSHDFVELWYSSQRGTVKRDDTVSKALTYDLVSQKLLRLAREMEGK